MSTKAIRIWNRKTQQEEKELVYGEDWLKFAYEHKRGKKLVQPLLSNPLTSVGLSFTYGLLQSSPLSRRKIAPFIQRYKIDMSEYEEKAFESFNDFFTRKFKSGKRTFVTDTHKMPAFAEGRYLAWEKNEPKQTFPVKGQFLTADALMGSPQKAQAFSGGPMLLARLCPTDYHRFHFPDSGRVLETFRVPGPLHSVNPAALHRQEDILCTNEREITLLETENFGKLAMIEVGAILVGKIVQSYPLPRFTRGEEKGYFLFGASTVILLGEPGKWVPSADLLEQTQEKRETRVLLGEAVASTR